jgi:hypothetical protein
MGTGGHHPWTACWNKKPVTKAGRVSQRRSRVAPRKTPPKAITAAFDRTLDVPLCIELA